MRNKSVMLAVGQEAQRKLMRSILLAQNIAVQEPETAHAVLEMIRRQRPDLIIIEIDLLYTAIQVAHLLKFDARWADTSLIALTSGGLGDERKAISAGCDAYLNMPIDSQSFQKTVSRFIFKKQMDVFSQGESDGLETGRILIFASPFDQKSIQDILVQNNFQGILVTVEAKVLETAEAERPDVILLDVVRPEGEGIDLIKSLKETASTRLVPILLIVAPGALEAKAAGLSAGADDFLVKPYRPIELLVRIESMINLKKYRQQAAESKSPAEDSPQEIAAGKTDEAGRPVVLVVGENEHELKSVEHALESLPVRSEKAPTGGAALVRLRGGGVQLMLLDFLLPDMDCFEFFRRLKEIPGCQFLPAIVLACVDNEEVKSKCLELGAEDCYQAPVAVRDLKTRVKALLSDKARFDRMQSQLAVALRSAIIDWSTGLHSRNFFNSFLNLEVRRSARHNYPISLILADIDGFQAFNDRYGFPAGDALLRELSLILRKGVRDIDLCARLGGDEFGIILPYCDRAGAFMVAQRIKQDIQSHEFFFNSISDADRISVSMGIAMFPGDTGTAQEIVEKAEAMMHLARQKGLNQIGL